MAKRVKESAPESGMVKVVDPMFDAPMDVEAIPEPTHAPSGPGFRQRVARVFEFFLRLVSWIIILGVIGGGLYFGLPLLYQRFVVPVEQNTVQVGELQSQQKLMEQQLADLQDELQTLEAGQSQNADALTALDQRVSDTETDITAHTKSLATLEQMQSELQSQDQATSDELQRQIELIKSMELLSRARLFMYQSNFGLARQDVQSARDLLMKIQPDASKTLADDLDAVIRRLDLALSNLPVFPVAAIDDLDIAWQILVSGLPQVSSSQTETPVTQFTPTITPEVTLSPTAQSTATP